jgi:hypothetical protein
LPVVARVTVKAPTSGPVNVPSKANKMPASPNR